MDRSKDATAKDDEKIASLSGRGIRREKDVSLGRVASTTRIDSRGIVQQRSYDSLGSRPRVRPVVARANDNG